MCLKHYITYKALIVLPTFEEHRKRNRNYLGVTHLWGNISYYAFVRPCVAVVTYAFNVYLRACFVFFSVSNSSQKTSHLPAAAVPYGQLITNSQLQQLSPFCVPYEAGQTTAQPDALLGSANSQIIGSHLMQQRLA